MNETEGIPLAPRDLLILSVLAAGDQHGYGIIKAVDERSEAKVKLDPANLYRVLRRMRRDDGSKRWRPGTARIDGGHTASPGAGNRCCDVRWTAWSDC